ncbi:hypothetical protein [Campylobacter sp.]|uniref:hypothetical protein n=1 Tax=Campylobacter sp. TaxID=205 RepID=UPI00270DA526|nr:hypothetical protein [Campylobacter sp.]
MTTVEYIRYLENTFGADLVTICESIKLSPSSRGYIVGAVSEYLLQEELKKNNYESHRIKEKWEGKKPFNHYGDFYFKKNDKDFWFVLESKGLKSNSEKWHKLYEGDKLKKFLFKHADKINWLSFKNKIHWHEIINFGKSDLLKKIQDHKKYWNFINKKNIQSKRKTNKFLLMKNELESFKDFFPINTNTELKIIKKLNKLHYVIYKISLDIDNWLKNNNLCQEKMELSYVTQKIKVIETHFVSGTSGSGNREQATPRKDEFNLISIDLFLRTKKHNFIYANPTLLEVSSSNENHLQQNYIVGFIFPEKEDPISLDKKYWYDNLKDAYDTIDDNLSIRKEDMQIDTRSEELMFDY